MVTPSFFTRRFGCALGPPLPSLTAGDTRAKMRPRCAAGSLDQQATLGARAFLLEKGSWRMLKQAGSDSQPRKATGS